ncbi:neugrin isoform X2 [Halichoeres trimaculatus]|uniref:neugrin isoform X2 n=1 Tax=Halichoeres trimaculatus TaxID=147232 RepID=UPI003D9E4F41
MARPFQLFSVLSRLCAPSVGSSLYISGCRFASRDASSVWMRQSQKIRDRASRYSDHVSDEEFGLEDVEDKLQSLVDEGRKRQKTVKYHILRRKMIPAGAPQRKLTWDAMEQIRYLKQEQPDEWTVERLAEGFSVSPDVILRVLRSKFVPSPQRRAKQDAKIMSQLSQKVLPSGAETGSVRQKLHGNNTPSMLPSGAGVNSVVPVAEKSLMLQNKVLESKMLVSSTVIPTMLRTGINGETQVTTSGETYTEESEEDEESWDGEVFTDDKLEEYINMEKPPPVTQVGNEYFDVEGNFLYRI